MSANQTCFPGIKYRRLSPSCPQSCVLREESPGCRRTFIHYHLPLPVFHRNAGPKTLMFIVPCDHKKAATVCCLLSHTTSTQHREHWQLLCEVTLIAVAPTYSRLCTFHPCHSPQCLFFSFLSFLLPLWRSKPPRAQEAG